MTVIERPLLGRVDLERYITQDQYFDKTTLYSEGFETAGAVGGWVAVSGSVLFNVQTAAHSGVRVLSIQRSTTPGVGSATRTITGLSVGRVTTASVWFFNTSNQASVAATIGVTGIGTSVAVAPEAADGWVQLSYTFTPTATSHVLVLSATQSPAPLYWDDIAVVRHAYVNPQPGVWEANGLDRATGLSFRRGGSRTGIGTKTDVGLLTFSLHNDQDPLKGGTIEPGQIIRAVTKPEPDVTVYEYGFEDGQYQPTPPTYSPWVEQRRNLVPVPQPTAYAGSGWAAAAGSLAAPGWIGATVNTPTTAYVFTDGAEVAIATGDVVTMAVTYKVTALGTGSTATHIRAVPHIRTGNLYYAPTLQEMQDQNTLRPIVIGQEETVVVRWTATRDVPAGDLDIALTSSINQGSFATVTGGFSWQATKMIAELGVTSGDFFDGASANTELQQTRWLDTANASMSVLETRSKTENPPTWVPDLNGWVGSATDDLANHGTYSLSGVNNTRTFTGLTVGASYTLSWWAWNGLNAWVKKTQPFTATSMSRVLTLPGFLPKDDVTLVRHSPGTPVFTGRVVDVKSTYPLNKATNKERTSVVVTVADAVNIHGSTMRYGIQIAEGFETFESRINRLASTALAPIEAPAQGAPREVYSF